MSCQKNPRFFFSVISQKDNYMDSGDRILYHYGGDKQIYGIVLESSSSFTKLNVLLDHTIDHAYRRSGNSAEIIKIERSKAQIVHKSMHPGMLNDLIRIDRGRKVWSWEIFNPAIDLYEKRYVVVCRPSQSLEEYNIILDYFRLLCFLPAIQKLNESLAVRAMYDKWYNGTIVGASPNHKYIIFSPSWDPLDYQYLKVTDPLFPADVRLQSSSLNSMPSPVILRPFFQEIISWNDWADVARVITEYHEIVKRIKRTRPDDIVTLGTQIMTPDSPRFCVSLCMLPESAEEVEMKESNNRNMHYIESISVSTAALALRYTNPPLITIDKPRIQPNDCIQAVAVCTSLHIDGRPGKIVISNPGLYRKKHDDPEIVPPEVFLLPSVWNDRKMLPIKVQIFPMDRKMGCQPRADSDVKNSYLVEVIHNPLYSVIKTRMNIKTLGWFVPIDKYLTIKRNFREMLQYTVDVIAVGIGVDVILLDDQSYVSIYGLTNDTINIFNANPEQLEPRKEKQSQSDRKPKQLFHPPFYKVLRSLSKGETLYTEMGFICLPTILLNAIEKFIEINPVSLPFMIKLMQIFSQTVNMLIHGLAKSIPISEFFTTDEILLLQALTQSAATRKEKSTPFVSEVATSFILLFRKHPASIVSQDYDKRIDRLQIWNLYNQFSRQVFTYEKQWIDDMDTLEGQTAYFHLYMSYVLQYVTLNQEEDIWTPEKLITQLSKIQSALAMESPIVDYCIETNPLEERVKMLRVLLWGYNSIFSSTRMYRSPGGLFQFKTLSRN